MRSVVLIFLREAFFLDNCRHTGFILTLFIVAAEQRVRAATLKRYRALQSIVFAVVYHQDRLTVGTSEEVITGISTYFLFVFVNTIDAVATVGIDSFELRTATQLHGCITHHLAILSRFKGNGNRNTMCPDFVVAAKGGHVVSSLWETNGCLQ